MFNLRENQAKGVVPFLVIPICDHEISSESIEQGRRKDEKSVKPASENECKKVVEMHVHQLVLTIVKLNLAMVLQCLF